LLLVFPKILNQLFQEYHRLYKLHLLFYYNLLYHKVEEDVQKQLKLKLDDPWLINLAIDPPAPRVASSWYRFLKRNIHENG
jgi:hypothetical protein